jgi:hypothetical protein
MAGILMTLPEYMNFCEDQSTKFGLIAQEALTKCARLRQDFPDWQYPHDARLAYFGQIANNCSTTSFLLLAAGDSLNNANWRGNTVLRQTPEDLKILVEETDKALRKNAFLHGWALTENALRRLISVYQSTDAVGAAWRLFKKFYRTDLVHPHASEIMELISLATATRNTSHNNFSYYPVGQSYPLLSYKGETYSFEIGKTISFFDWDFVRRVLLDLLEMFEETVRHKSISTLPLVPSH